MRAQLDKAEGIQPEPAKGDSDYISKFREFKYSETLFELFTKQYEIARVDESREGAVIQVVDVAMPPELKRQPKKMMLAVTAAVVTGFALLLLVFLRRALQIAASDPKTAQQMVALRTAWMRALGRA